VTTGRHGVRRGVGAGHVDDRGYRYGAFAGNPEADRRRAVRQVASRSKNADECAWLLAMLGLAASEGQVSSECAS
jgi:hypothetical protein